MREAGDLDGEGRYEAARSRYLAAEELLDGAPETPEREATRALCLLRQAGVSCLADPGEDVCSLVAEGLLAAQQGGCLLEAARWLSVLGARLVRTGRTDQALNCLAAAREIFAAAEDEDGQQGLAWVALTLGQIALVAGDAEEAGQQADLANRIFTDLGHMALAGAAASLLLDAEEAAVRDRLGGEEPDDES
ncbi:MAG: hypothetical protein ACE5R4_07825 [Armatimonadota bacterium]